MRETNFIEHKNGIHVIEENATEEEARDMLLDNSIPEEEIDDSMIDNTIQNLNEMTFDDFLYDLPFYLKCEGYYINIQGVHKWSVWVDHGAKLVAEVKIESGYYELSQVIVETDPEYLIKSYIGYGVEEDTYSHYLSNSTKDLFKVVKGLTKEVQSNQEIG